MGEIDVALPHIPKACDDTGAAIHLRLQPIPPRPVAHHLVDQQFHGMHAVADEIRLGDAIILAGLAQQKMVHAADLRARVPQTHGDARAEEGRDHHARAAHHGVLALDDGNTLHGDQVNSPKTRSILSLSAAGAKGLTI